MPYCPKCETRLTKNKRLKIYTCKRHGFARKINTVEQPKTENARLFCDNDIKKNTMP